MSHSAVNVTAPPAGNTMMSSLMLPLPDACTHNAPPLLVQFHLQLVSGALNVLVTCSFGASDFEIV